MEFNQGKPLTEASIAGEKGAIFDTDSIALKFAYFDGAKGVWDSSPVGILEKSRGDMFDNSILSTCRWATLPELLAAGLSEAEALPMLHSSQKPQGDGWGPWTEWKGGECPIPGVKEWWYRFRDGEEGYSHGGVADCVYWEHRGMSGDIVAYRVRLTAQQPPTTESDRDIDIGDGVDENARMVERDAAGMAGCEKPEPVAPFELQIEPEEARGLLVLAPLERLGATRWGAE